LQKNLDSYFYVNVTTWLSSESGLTVVVWTQSIHEPMVRSSMSSIRLRRWQVLGLPFGRLSFVVKSLSQEVLFTSSVCW
jgi:hypothetical protein